jgi:hypothetical protein
LSSALRSWVGVEDTASAKSGASTLSLSIEVSILGNLSRSLLTLGEMSMHGLMKLDSVDVVEAV